MDYRVYRNIRRSRKLNALFWRFRPYFARSPLWCGLWQSFAEGNRLTLPSLNSETLHALALQEVVLPGTRDPKHGQDAPLADLVILLQLAKRLRSARILEIGTYRAKTTYALRINLPDAYIASYDICRVESPYRNALELCAKTSLRISDFGKTVIEPSSDHFDFVFIDAGHRLREVLDDTKKAFSILKPGGCILWHDYRVNEFLNPGLEVPEALKEVSKDRTLYWIPGTTCAIFQEGLAATGRLSFTDIDSWNRE